jgi:hypothetical protein
MDAPPVVLIFALFIALAIGFGIVAYLQAEKRKKELAEWAAAHGFSFDTASDYDFDSRYPEFDSLRQGDSRYAYNIIEGSAGGYPICAFDYHYATHSTDSKGRRQTHHHHFSSVIVDSGMPLKPLRIRSEGFFDKVGEFIGIDDIDFESAEFSRTFHVKAPDRRWAYDVLHQKAMEFLLESPRFTIEFQDRRVLTTGNGTSSAGEYEAAIDVTTRLLGMIPSTVRRELNENR